MIRDPFLSARKQREIALQNFEASGLYYWFLRYSILEGYVYSNIEDNINGMNCAMELLRMLESEKGLIELQDKICQKHEIPSASFADVTCNGTLLPNPSITENGIG